jgi:mannose-6-phosphate isomerase-like protein (cupin superfamily)
MIIKKDEVTPIDFGGLSILDYTAGREEQSSFAVIAVPPGVSHQRSWSKRSDKFYYVMEGAVDFTVDGASSTLFSGDFCIVRKGAVFAYANSSGRPASLILVHTPDFRLDEEVFE